MPTISLWPDIFATAAGIRGVRKILEEAGDDLGERSGNVLRFRVRVSRAVSGFLYLCEVVVKNDIGIEVCRVETGLAAFPANVYTADGYQALGVRDEAELKSHLAKVFQSERTKEILVNLIANFG